MKFVYSILFAYLFLTNIDYVYSQDYNPEELEQILERIAEETGVTPELDAIENLIANPINLYTAKIVDIIKIPGFTHSISKKILELVKLNDKINCNKIIDTLRLSDEQAYLLRLCTVIEPLEIKQNYRTKNLYWRARTEHQFENRKGFEKNIYLGNSLDYYQRASLFINDFSANLTTTKDAGENKFIDFYSANVSGSLFDFKITIGDFYAESGLGSILWKSFGLRKGSDAISPVSQLGLGINPYRSSLENNYFRGFALQRNWHLNSKSNIFTAFWISSTNRSAYIDTNFDIATSIKQDGYFRTTNEQKNRDNLNEKSIGGIFEWSNNNFLLGGSALSLDYNKPIYSKSKEAFWGSSGFLASLYANWYFDNITICSELSKDASGNLGIKAALTFESKKWSTAILFRSFDGNFRSPFGYNFGESSIPSNEIGLYWGINLKLIENMSISAYFDIFKNLTRTYDLSMPGKGNEVFSELEWKIAPKTIFRFRLRYEQKTEQSKDTSSHYRIFQNSKYSVRADFENSISTKLRFRARIEGLLLEPEAINTNEKGILAFIELVWQPVKESRIGGRLTYFSTDSYNSAIWQYEGVMPGIMTAPALYGNGSRAYIFVKFSLFQSLDLWLKYTYLTKNNVNSLGSGWDEIQSNKDQRLLLQFEFKF